MLTLGSYRNPLLSALIRALKGGDHREDLSFIAQAWVRKSVLVRSNSLKPPVVLIPCPSRKKGERDHAFALAQALSAVTQWPVKTNLIVLAQDGRSQKQKGRLERTERRFLAQESPDLSVYGTIIFIDDVVTTGSTVEAAWKALHRPENFEVWCVAFQPRLAGKPTI
jgi:predicted amidophosphoribosyltransferase